MNKENIPVITDREKLYDKCENMEQLFDKYYLPLLDKHYSKTYELQQENQALKKQLEELKEENSRYERKNQKYKEVIDKAIKKLEQEITFCQNESQGLYDKCNIAINREQRILDILKEVEQNDF